MVWVRLDDGFHDHRKVIALGRDRPVAGWLFVTMLSYSNRYLTDGHVPAEHVHARQERLVARLHDVGLLEVCSDHEGCHVVHDFFDWNRSREEVLADREKTRRRVEKHRGNGVTEGAGGGDQTTRSLAVRSELAASSQRVRSENSFGNGVTEGGFHIPESPEAATCNAPPGPSRPSLSIERDTRGGEPQRVGDHDVNGQGMRNALAVARAVVHPAAWGVATHTIADPDEQRRTAQQDDDDGTIAAVRA